MTTKRKRISLFSLLVIVVLSITIGYAAINSIVLNITGKLDAEAPKEIFITNVEYVSDVSAQKENSEIQNYIGKTVQSKIALSTTNANSEIIYKVSIYNNTKESGIFLDAIYDKDNYDNENIIYEILNTGFKPNDEIKPKETKEIYIKFKYKDATIASNNVLNSYIKFSIGKPNMLKTTSNTGDYFGSVTRSKIEKISFELGKILENAIQTFDASEKQDKSITGYVTDKDSNGLYEITFSSDDIIYANTNSSYLFYGLLNITEISFNNFKTDKTENMKYMFYNDEALTNLDVSSFNTTSVADMSSMFYNCSGLTSLNVSSFNTSNVTDMSSMFYYCDSLTSLDVSNFNTSNVTDMYSMFNRCSGLTSLDVSSFDTSNVTDMYGMFNRCSGLTNLDVSNFNTSNVTDMSSMFSNCSGLISLDVSSFNTSNVTDMYNMFNRCRELISLDVSNFDTSSVTNMSSMFYNCNGLISLDVSNFNTSSITNMSSMFRGCEQLTNLDVREFDTSNVTDMSYMFSNCSKLTTIYASNKFNTDKVTSSSSMFSNCSLIVGGNGTEYNASYIDKTYARIDTAETPGYFTSKERKKKGLKICPESTFWDIVSKTEVTSVTFGNTIENASDSAVDVSEAEDGSILAWLDATKLYVSSNDYIYANPDSSKLFYSCTAIRNIDFSNFNTSNVTTIMSMFYNCKNLAKLDLSGFDTSNVTDMYGVFTGCEYLTSIDLSSFDTSKVTRMAMMFHSCSQLTSLDLSNFNTSNVTNTNYMFGYCTKLTTIYISELFNTKNVKDSSGMFQDCTSIIGGTGNTYYSRSVDVRQASETGYCTKSKEKKVLKSTSDNYNFWGLASAKNVKNVVFEDKISNVPSSAIDVSESEDRSILAWLESADMSVHIASAEKIYANPESSYMFAYLGSATEEGGKITNINFLNTSNVTNMSSMFKQCSVSSLYLRNFNTSSATNMSSMFEDCNLEELDLRKFDTVNVTDMSGMFKDCKNLKTIYVTGKFETEKADSSANMFLNCTSLTGEKGTKYNTNNINKKYAKIDMSEKPGYFTYIESKNFLKICPENTFWDIVSKSQVTTSVIFENTTKNAPSTATDISEKCDGSIVAWLENTSFHIASDKKIYAQPISHNLLSCKAESIKFGNFDTDEVINMSNMFYFCNSLKELDVSTFNTSSVANMSLMFEYTNLLEALDVTTFDTSNVTDMYSMFSEVSQITTLDLSNFNTSNVTNMSSMFSSCSNLINVNLSSFDTNKVTNMSSMFYQCEALTSLDVSNFDTSKVTNMGAMFRECSVLNHIFVSDRFDTSKVTNSNYMFYYASALEGGNGTRYNVDHIDATYARIDTTSTPGYFTEIYSGELKNLGYTSQSSTYFWNTDITKDSIEKISFEKNFIPTNAIKTFIVSPNIEKNKVIGYVTDNDFNGKYEITVSSNVDIYAPRNSSYLFKGLTALNQITFNNFNTTNVTNMYYMFYECKSLSNVDLSNFNTANVTNMSWMFYRCESITTLNVSNFDTSKVTNMSWMFAYCKALVDFDLSSFNTSGVTNMSYIFYECNNLVNLNLNSFDTVNVTNMAMMFYNCYSLINLDLSSFNTSNVTDMSSMFEKCTNLKTIYVSNDFNTTKVTRSNNMFSSTSSLVGGNGTKYNESYINKTYARIDKAGQPGYFTLKVN